MRVNPILKKQLEGLGFDVSRTDKEIVAVRRIGKTMVQVQCFGLEWGYTAWHEGDCIGGKLSGEWGPFQACEAGWKFVESWIKP